MAIFFYYVVVFYVVIFLLDGQKEQNQLWSLKKLRDDFF